MAEIKMDVSEYELLKENKRLLEASLEKERSLQKEIETLNKEKIKALEEAKMKVVKITRSERKEHKCAINDGRVEKLMQMWGIPTAHRNYAFEEMIRCFTTVTSQSFPQEEITTHGLDEIKQELRTEIKASIDSETKGKLEDAARINEKFEGLIRDKGILTGEIEQKEKENKILLERVSELETIKKELSEKTELVNNIRKVMGNNYGFFENSRKLSEVTKLLV